MRSSILEATFWKTELKKNIALICFIEITSILAYAKVQLNQAVKPYPFDVVKRRLLISYCDILKILKMKFFSSLMLKIFRSHLTWKLSWTPSHKWSPLFQWTWTRLNFPLQKGLPWSPAGYETWFTGATLIEIGVYFKILVTTIK